MVVNKDIDITHLPIGDLRPDPANPRRISDEELESLTRSIKEFGLVDPIIARKQDNVVIGGHQRLLAARKLGLKQVPVVLVDLSGEQAHLLNLALNRISGSWDQELLARLLGELKDVPDVDITLTGFSEEELQKHLKSLESREKRERLETFDLDAALEAAQAAPVARTGDLWLLGDHRREAPVRRFDRQWRRGALDEWRASLPDGDGPALPGGLLRRQPSSDRRRQSKKGHPQSVGRIRGPQVVGGVLSKVLDCEPGKSQAQRSLLPVARISAAGPRGTGMAGERFGIVSTDRLGQGPWRADSPSLPVEPRDGLLRLG